MAHWPTNGLQDTTAATQTPTVNVGTCLMWWKAA